MAVKEEEEEGTSTFGNGVSVELILKEEIKNEAERESQSMVFKALIPY